MINLSTIANPLGTSKKTKKIILKNISSIHLYPQINNAALRDMLANILQIPQNQVLVTDGADGALTLLATHLFKGKDIIIPSPCFQRYKEYTNLGYGTCVNIQPNNILFLNTEELLSRKSSSNEILLFASPNNPTGLIIENDIIKRLCIKYNTIILDETLSLSLNTHHNFKDEIQNGLIIVRSFSKLFGLAGLRLGYIIAQKECIENISKNISPFNVNILAQHAGIAALHDIKFQETIQVFIKKEKERLLKKKVLNNGTLSDSKTLCYCLVLTEKQKEALQKEKIFVQDCAVFVLPSNYVRVAIGTKEQNDFLIKTLNSEKGDQNG